MTGTTYPSQIAFHLEDPWRARLLAAARHLRLEVRDLSPTAFVVTVPDARTAFELGRLTVEEADGGE